MKMEKEFKLSDKVDNITETHKYDDGDRDFIDYVEIKILNVKDVKEFIDKNDSLVSDLIEGLISPDEYWDKKNKLVGDL